MLGPEAAIYVYNEGKEDYIEVFAQMTKKDGSFLVSREKNEDLIQKRREMWEECAHGVNDFDDIVDMNAYDETVREHYGHFVRKEQTVRQLEYLKEVPYSPKIQKQLHHQVQD